MTWLITLNFKEGGNLRKWLVKGLNIVLFYQETVSLVVCHSNGSCTASTVLSQLWFASTSPTRQFLTTLMLLYLRFLVFLTNHCSAFRWCSKREGMPKEMDISIMPDPEPPADMYLSKGKKLSSPKKKFQVNLAFNFTQYSKMTKIVYTEESFHGDIFGDKRP